MLLILINKILNFKKFILLIIFVVVILSVLAMTLVQINYDLTDYLPKDAPSTVAMDVIENSFSEAIPNVNVFIPDLTIPQALAYKERLSEIPGVNSVLWLDDVVDIHQPLSTMDLHTVEGWYKDSDALFMLAGDTNESVAIIAEITKVSGEGSILSGALFNQATIQSLSTGEVSQIMFYMVPLVIIILLISTSSWFEPLLFLIAIGVAILINEGTNIFIGEVSYITQATSAVLQLAISMDYAVFLLHSFSKFRSAGNNVEEAMKKAMAESTSAIAASAITTIFGFLALTLMRFQIGLNMGLVLAKGIIFSFLSVMLLLPILAIYTTKIMDKTHHRSFLPSFKGFSKNVVRICIPLALIIFLVIIPSFLAQQKNDFIYGSSGIYSDDSQAQIDANFVKDIFGEKQQMVLLVPEGDAVQEASLNHALKHIPNVTSIISYPNTVGSEIPPEFLSTVQLSQFRSSGYSRYIFYAETTEEGEEAFALVAAVKEATTAHYGENFYLLGQNVVNYDLKQTIIKDTPRVNGVAIISIGLVLLLTFRSLTIPLILLLTIEGAIWINLGIPYFRGTSLNYVGFLIISAVQLGATVDYGILFAHEYMKKRKTCAKRKAAELSIFNTAASILTPASILALASVALGIVSTNGIISELGLMLGRGALISAFMVLCFLPALLVLFDPVIQKTTLIKRRNDYENTSL